MCCYVSCGIIRFEVISLRSNIFHILCNILYNVALTRTWLIVARLLAMCGCKT